MPMKTSVKNAINYFNIINSLPEPIYWTDKNSVVVGCNEAEAKLFGLKAEEAIGKNMHNFAEMLGWDRKISDILRKNDIRIMETGIAQCIEESVPSLDGKTKRIFLSHKAPFYDDNGSIIGIIGTSIDITRNKQIFDNKPSDILDDPNCLTHSLSKREKDCISYFLLGETIQSTARRLFISPRTVETHLENIKNKLGCNKKSDLIAKLIKYGFVPAKV